jgi:hypothetical protein
MEKTMRKPIKVTAAIASGALVVATAGVAYAYWTSTGNGSGDAKAGTASNWTVGVTQTTTPALTPGGLSQAVTVTVTNPSTGVQYLNGVGLAVKTAANGIWSVGSGVATCDAGDFEITPVAFTAGEVATTASKTATFTIAMKNNNENQDACQGVPVPLYASAS